jgi:hypothetical protein
MRKSRDFRACEAQVVSRRQEHDCLAGDAVLIARRSPGEFPANREFYREFCFFASLSRFCDEKSLCRSGFV